MVTLNKANITWINHKHETCPDENRIRFQQFLIDQNQFLKYLVSRNVKIGFPNLAVGHLSLSKTKLVKAYTSNSQDQLTRQSC